MLKQDKQRFLKDYKRLKNNQGPDGEEMQYLMQAKNAMEQLQR